MKQQKFPMWPVLNMIFIVCLDELLSLLLVSLSLLAQWYLLSIYVHFKNNLYGFSLVLLVLDMFIHVMVYTMTCRKKAERFA